MTRLLLFNCIQVHEYMANEIIPQISQTWAIHNRTMLYLIDHLPEDALDCSLSKRGGRNIAVQLAHCISVRYFRLEAFIKKHNLSFNEFPKNHVPNREELLEAFTVSGQIMEQVIEMLLKMKEKRPHLQPVSSL